MHPELDPHVILSIIVPTYKRPAELRRLVERYLPVLRNDPRVNLLISSNCPGHQETDRVLDEILRLQIPSIRCIRQGQNLGGVLHLAYLLAQGTGRFTWLHGDDDLIGDGELEILLDQLERTTAAYLYVPSKYEDEDLNKISLRIPKLPATATDLYLANFPRCTLVTSSIIRTDRLSTSFSKLNSLNCYFHFPLILDAIHAGHGESIKGVLLSIGRGTTCETTRWSNEMMSNHMYRWICTVPQLNAQQRKILLRIWYREFPFTLLCLAINWPFLYLKALSLAPEILIFSLFYIPHYIRSTNYYLLNPWKIHKPILRRFERLRRLILPKRLRDGELTEPDVRG